MHEDEYPQVGRPYGGMAIICSKHRNLNYKEIDTGNNRIMCLLVQDKCSCTVQVILSVYMPYYQQGNNKQTELFVENLDKLQAMVDLYGSQAPVKICGDFNTQLPQKDKLQQNWHKQKGFNSHSRILYDFLLSNELIVSDFMFGQKSTYTYFVHKNRTYTWIDHVMAYKHDIQNITNCRIMCDDGNNVSDHLPIETICQLHCGTKPSSGTSNLESESAVFTAWTSENTAKYKDLVEEKMVNLPSLDISGAYDKCSIRNKIDEYIDSLNDSLLNAAKEAGCSKPQSSSRKPYWCPDLSLIRDRKRFWYHLWCQNGRPRSGVVYQCDKDLKRLYRKKSKWNLDHI